MRDSGSRLPSGDGVVTSAEFIEAVKTEVDIVGFQYPSRACYIWISDKKHVAELWHDDVNRRAELQLHKMGHPQLSVAAFPLTARGASDAGFCINDYIAKV
jgi:hypothetical protein